MNDKNHDVARTIDIQYIHIPGPVYEKYLTLEPDDMGDSPVENSVDDLESETTEDGKASLIDLCDVIYGRPLFSSLFFCCEYS